MHIKKLKTLGEAHSGSYIWVESAGMYIDACNWGGKQFLQNKVTLHSIWTLEKGADLDVRVEGRECGHPSVQCDREPQAQ